MKNTIVYKDPNAYSCFPSIIKKDNGELLVAFRRAGGFSLEAVRQGKYDHVDKGARIAMCRSLDDGLTWEPATIFPQFDLECGEQDPSIGLFDHDQLIINFFQWRVVPAEEKNRLLYPTRQQYDGSWSDVEGPFIIRSFDDGKSWDKSPIKVLDRPLPRAGTSDAVIELPDGTLMMGIYCADFGSPICRAYTIRSFDQGISWDKPVLIAKNCENKISFEEPALAITKEGHLIAVLRAGEPRKYQYLYRAFSYDSGKSWANLEQTPMCGHPAHVLRLSDGRLLCAYGYRRQPYGIRACISNDSGKTWDIEHEFVLRDDGESVDLGYPCSAELDNGTIVTVYYIHGQDGIRHIAATHWQLE